MTTSSLPSTPHSPTPTTTHVPVLISGAGPTGLLAGILLAKMGIPTKLIERDMTVSPLSKAISIHPRSLEILRSVSPELLDRFKKECWINYTGRVYFGGNLSAEIPWNPATDSQFHHTWSIPQTRTIGILTEEYERTGLGCVDRGWELMDTKVVEGEVKTSDGSTETKSWVETTIRRAIEGTNARKGESTVLGVVEMAEEDADKKYELQVVKSEFLIAADGGRSTVRHVLNIPFPGRTRDFNIILFDGHIESDLPTNEMASISGRNMHTVGVFPIYGNRVRFLLGDGTLTQEEFAARKNKTPTKEYFEKLLEETVSPHKIKILSYNWLTYYRVNERRAAEYTHKQRIFLAGDAAHCHSPIGGQGLNTGLQDSYNLAWKIAMVLKGTAPLSLVDSYNEERPPIADQVIQFSSKSIGMLLSENYFIFHLKKALVYLLPYLQPFLPAPTGSPTFAMLGLRYFGNSLNKEHPNQRYDSKAPASIGQRAPDDWVYPLSADMTDPSRLYSLMDTPGAFQVLVFTADRLAQEKQGLEATLFDNIEHYQGSWRSMWPGTGAGAMSKGIKATPQFVVHVISNRGPDGALDSKKTKEVEHGKMHLNSEKGDLHRRYGITAQGGIVVVRPDTHISFRVASLGKSAWSDVDQYFKSILQKSAVITI
ncbi:hypothetical protein BGX33_007225 [Mortierella sp. NVP41]|nr:hypothetical protein BGX33_007225 [Mortierella sp. NVP41]